MKNRKQPFRTPYKVTSGYIFSCCEGVCILYGRVNGNKRVQKIREVFYIKKGQIQVNSQIRDKEIRLIDFDGTMIGVISAREAQLKANEREMDLVKISPNADPPVCKIMDYGKYLYELSKKEKEAKKKQTNITVKEIRLSAKIEEHDFTFKLKNAIKFLQDGDKVKVSIRFRGREVQFTSMAYQVIDKFADMIREYGKMEKRPVMEGRSMSVMFLPLKEK